MKLKLTLASFTSLIFISTSAIAAQLECATVSPLINGFLAQHLTHKKLSPQLEERTITQFVKMLDPSKLYLLQSDVEAIKTNLGGIFAKIGSKKCDDLESSQKIYEKRVSESSVFAKKLLGPTFKFNESTSITIDPAKREYAKTKTELEDLQARYIQFQISNYLASEMKLAEAKKQLIHRYEVTLKHVTESKKYDLYAIFLDAFASALDPHSNFLSKDVLEDFEITMRLSLEGIGATLSSQDGYTVIENLIPGGAAFKSSELEPKDKIIGVAQGDSDKFEQVIDMPLRDVVKLIRGKKGTKVKLSILRQGKSTTRHIVSLVRDKIDLKDEAAKISYIDKTVGDKKYKIGVINLPSFYSDSESGTRSCSADVRKLVDEANASKVDGIILDLSKNGGGVLGEAVRVAGLFIKKGNIVETQDADGRVENLADLDSVINYSGPMVVLTSRLSASASEIVAGALQDYKRAVIIGSDHTFGKGSVQAVMKLREDLGAIKVTTGMFFTPSGDSTQEKGVLSDVRFPSPYISKEFSEAALDYPLEQKTLASFLSPESNDVNGATRYIPITQDAINELRKNSKARVSKDTEFLKIETELKDREKKGGILKLADMMKKTQESNKEKVKKTKKIKDGVDPDYLTQPSVKESLNILVDLITFQKDGITLAKKGDKEDAKRQ
ncbi:MAG: S41 family peptidase [Oligoflexia bacterium]|nr:S41 family peptidase [Oligoflexia bacterium]